MKNNYTLVAVNAKYIHSNLSLQYIRSYCQTKNISLNFLELNINDNIDKIINDIYLTKSNVFAFSCYIWNIEIILKICSSLKKIIPDSIIILGGPEVSYESIELMNCHKLYIDYIIYGEGEITFYELLRYLEDEKTDIKSIQGLIYKNNESISMNKKRKEISDLDSIPFPYKDISNYKNKIIYYETSRGCPFQCQYCLSSIEKSVRYFSLDRVYKDIDYFIENQVKQVKLVDRTFNSDKKRCLSILNYIISKNGKTNFHFEISPKLIDEDFITVIKKAPVNLFQFEIGIQSTNPATLRAVRRKELFKDTKSNIKSVLDLGLFHIHLDLIAGLPCEDIYSFENSFNDAYSLQPDMLQLGFLKLLKGSGLRTNAVKYKIEYRDYPPYEVLSTDCLSFENMLLLKNVESMLNTFYNSGRFIKSIAYIEKKYFNSPFKLYLALADYFNKKGYLRNALKNVDLYSILYNFVSDSYGMTLTFNELLKYDYFVSFGMPIPSFVKRFENSGIKALVNSFLKNEENIKKYLPELQSMDIRKKLKAIHFETFYIDVTGDLKEKEVVLFKLKNTKKECKNKIISIDINKLKE
ncbi:MAG: B12-binding domain-containing radical SAM protein [Firmicutes bacterium]|nr:B12-binding domain-containing radical SAM protein [Bacillota bacterium]